MTEFASLNQPHPIQNWLANVIMQAQHQRPRSVQKEIGPSEIGNPCDRAIAFRLQGVPVVNFSDPLRAFVGTAVHAELASALEAEQGRYFIERSVTYRGVTGHLDLFDRFTGALVDFKTLPLSKLKWQRTRGLSNSHQVQAQTYAAGLMEAGERVRSIVVCFIPVDGTLDDIWPVVVPVDREIADKAIDRLEEIRALGAVSPAEVQATPSALCPWCSWYNPDRPTDSSSCQGGMEEKQSREQEEGMQA